MPSPASFPQEAWRHEVQRGYDFYFASGRTDLTVPVQADVHQYFISRAPERLRLRDPDPIDPSWVELFRRREVTIAGMEDAAVSFVDVVDAGDPLGRGIVFTDMRGGGVGFVPINEDGTLAPPIEIGRMNHPAAVRLCDWDGDGQRDFLVAGLGSFLPADHDKGRVVWFQQRSESPGEFHEHTLCDQVGRVASIEVADFNGDGSDDLLVAEFGWHETGSVFWLQRSSPGQPVDGMVRHTVDARSGAIHVPVVDLNDDGAPDFVALFSQQYERVEAMINDGQGRFRSELIHAAPVPSYGSSGIRLADVNQDGRVDVLYTNGDSFDSFLLKPYHGVHWLENRGEFPFTPHRLGAMPGAHRAVEGDFDGDGRLDVLAGAFVPRDLLKSGRHERAEALNLWRQDASGGFSKKVLSGGDCIHAALDVADVNDDSQDDLVIGNFYESGAGGGPVLTVWFRRPPNPTRNP